MGGDLADPPDEPTTASLPDCPLCGQPVTTVTIHGPATAVAAPCGCRAPPEVLLVDPDAALDATEGKNANSNTGSNPDTEQDPADPDDPDDG
ncbi:hypothetical protein [Natrialba asiatica]|uniref:Small CPxCG-related zinc finger protein n=1 Tax=Natrialba asiatica (strain ATCC 700177 / DSM 12278 / JCM 9576 / FERM P-10747 / NBRC 102637 / 172P1) TaxID=29540 RepID=M0B1V6_NATA1|nr:hypothetical protein [Natrialba asiatica]ELZ04891.1 hypothetical protein C481_03892 [Natrialba asiatica DSM 12278]